MRFVSIVVSLMVSLVGVPFVGEAEAGSAIRLKSVKALHMQGIHRQTLDYSCGAASLSILLQQYFGDSFDERSLLADITFRLSPEEMKDRITKGFSMLDLKRAAERLGYSAEGVMLPRKAVSALRGPVIVLLRRKDLNHFVVLKGARDGRAFLADPARGHLRVPLHSFFQEWGGEALVLGRDGFGLPVNHALSISFKAVIASEQEVVRTLQHAPAP